MRVEVIRETPDRLARERWRFNAQISWGDDRIAVRLEYYAPEVRATPRHKYAQTGHAQQWSATDERPYFSRIARAAVPLPADVLAEALDTVRAAVYFKEPD